MLSSLSVWIKTLVPFIYYLPVALSNSLPVISLTKLASFSSHGISISRSWFSHLNVLNKYIWIFSCKLIAHIWNSGCIIYLGLVNQVTLFVVSERVWKTLIPMHTAVCSPSKSVFHNCSCETKFALLLFINLSAKIKTQLFVLSPKSKYEWFLCDYGQREFI